jgi:hypothetical protein
MEQGQSMGTYSKTASGSLAAALHREHRQIGRGLESPLVDVVAATGALAGLRAFLAGRRIADGWVCARAEADERR